MKVLGYDPMDYEQKYPPDPILRRRSRMPGFGGCVSTSSRYSIRIYLRMRAIQSTVLLVFAGLFSAVVTAFLIQAADKLEPDYVQLSSSILFEILVVQRALANGSAVDLDPVISSPDALRFMPLIRSCG
ncbi:hypothetical protein BDZ89DRAFT_1207202 [Hymenopellis radicata]|nr:hypothetical protein BDZ89DRAFT_1207202 [Hymenopellis radicata]